MDTAMFWFAFGLVAGYKLASIAMTYKWAWRDCCLKHYESAAHKRGD